MEPMLLYKGVMLLSVVRCVRTKGMGHQPHRCYVHRRNAEAPSRSSDLTT